MDIYIPPAIGEVYGAKVIPTLTSEHQQTNKVQVRA